jgi:outer membrane immunogenic protein
MKLRRLVWSAIALTCATAASADGLPSRRASAPVAADDCCQGRWGGLYIGAAVGVAIAETDFNESHFPPPEANVLDFRDTSTTGTVTIGYDRQLRGNTIFGVLVDYTFGDQESAFDLIYSAIPLTQRVHLTYEDTWSVGARLGFVRGATLWYGAAGYTRTRANFEDFAKENLDGYFVAAGVEHQLRDRLTLKLEYRFSDYGETTLFNETSLACGVPCGQRIDIDTHVHAIRLGINYRFGDLHHHRSAYDPMK